MTQTGVARQGTATSALVGVVAALLLAICPVGAPASAATRQGAQTPVLGVRHSFGRDSRGWGQARPATLFNGGDPSGLIRHIHWSSWGGTTAHGLGRTYAPKPRGGYYRKTVAIRLRATDRGTCPSSATPAYQHLFVEARKKPGGQFGPWTIWTSYHRDLCKPLT